MQSINEALKNLSDFSHTSIEAKFKEVAEQNTISPGSVMQIFRVAVSGVAAGPAIFEMVSLIGKEKVVDRIEKAIQKFNQI